MLAITLQEKTEYLPMFRDHRYASHWLPNTHYVTRYQDGNTKLVCTWEEDIDVTTTTLPGGIISGENLILWREGQITKKFGSLRTYAVYLGWDSQKENDVASYQVTLPPFGFDLNVDYSMVFSMADAHEEQDNVDPIDLSIEVTDRDGTIAVLPLSWTRVISPRFQEQLIKTAAQWSRDDSEPILQTFEIPLSAFLMVDPALKLEKLISVRLVFNRTTKGKIILDDLGFRNNG